MNWFRCYSEFATDSKVQILPENMQRRLIMLFCLRCSNVLATLHATEIAFSLRITEQELEETKALFISKGFIDDTWNILNWDKRQYTSDTSTERSRKHRENKKKSMQQPCNVAATPPDQNQNRTDTESEGDSKGDFFNLKKDSGLDFDISTLVAPELDMYGVETARILNLDYLLLKKKYNDLVKHDPPKYPNKAFKAWLDSYTKPIIKKRNGR